MAPPKPRHLPQAHRLAMSLINPCPTSASHLSVSSILAKDFHLNFSFHSISPAYIEFLLGKIKCNKSCGPDNITPKILKLSTPALAVPLTNLLNHCIATSRWPNEWKLSNVTPVFKKGDALLVSNYRPISILLAIPKIMEKVMFDQLYDAFQPVYSLLICLGSCVVTHVVLLLLKRLMTFGGRWIQKCPLALLQLI